MKLKAIINSDPTKTQIVNAETGEALDNVVAIRVYQCVETLFPEVHLVLVDVPVELQDLEVTSVAREDCAYGLGSAYPIDK